MVAVDVTGNVDREALRDAYSKSANFKAIFDFLGERKKDSSITKTDRLMSVLAQKGTALDRKDAIDFFRTIENAGCGEYIEGRRGHPSRFSWEVSLRSVAQVARGTTEAVEAIIEDDSNGEEALMMEHSFRLRAGLAVALSLPDDLTIAEGERLSDFVRTLAIR